MEQRRKEEQDRSKPLGVCSQCKREFRCRFRRGELFCSSICKKEFLDGFKAQGTQEKDCLECNEVFRPRTKYQLYCSVKCRGSAFTAAKGLGMDLSEYSQELSKKRGHIIAETSQTTPLFKPSVPDQAPEPVVLEPSHQTAPLEKKELDLAEIQRLAVRSAFLGEE